MRPGVVLKRPLGKRPLGQAILQVTSLLDASAELTVWLRQSHRQIYPPLK